MNRPAYTWLLFGLCLAALLAAMGWASFKIVELDDLRAADWERAGVEERARIALWSMDSAVAYLVAQESARPYYHYGTYFRPDGGRSPVTASPLAGAEMSHILLHFQFDENGVLFSPQLIGPGAAHGENEGKSTAAVRHSKAKMRFEQLQGTITRADLEDALRRPIREPADEPETAEAGTPVPQPQGQAAQSFRNKAEFERRSNFSQQAVDVNNPANTMLEQQVHYINAYNMNINEFLAEPLVIAPPAGDSAAAVMQPLWLKGHLFLARRIEVQGRVLLQACWLDAGSIEKWLLGEIRDLLPEARLSPDNGGASLAPGEIGAEPENEHRLATLPFALVPGFVGDIPPLEGSPLKLSLLVAWGCILLAAGAVAVLLKGTLTLSERRAAFVSAVTHELRTPLTTMQMYSEMLAEGMVSEADKRQSYMDTLRAEADRLGHLVENVLAFARLERGAFKGRMENVATGELIGRIRPRLEQRAGQAGMELAVEVDEASRAATVWTDPAAVEQILFNLVDNACKYAAAGPDRTIRLRVDEADTGLRGDEVDGPVRIRVCDNGPGIAADEVGRLFKPFRKSARDAAHSAPGVGLGLALSRRLARMMGGRLVLDETVREGACFVLELPRK